jgi:hypothetical protein
MEVYKQAEKRSQTWNTGLISTNMQKNLDAQMVRF